jgi:hypothetical protein
MTHKSGTNRQNTFNPKLLTDFVNPGIKKCVYIADTGMRSKQRDPKPNNNIFINSSVRKQRCKRRAESLTCRHLFSCQGVSLRVRVPLFATHYRVWLGRSETSLDSL